MVVDGGTKEHLKFGLKKTHFGLMWPSRSCHEVIQFSKRVHMMVGVCGAELQRRKSATALVATLFCLAACGSSKYLAVPTRPPARAEHAMMDYPGLPAQSCLPLRSILTRSPGLSNSSLVTRSPPTEKGRQVSPSIEDLAVAIVPSKLDSWGNTRFTCTKYQRKMNVFHTEQDAFW